MSAKPQYIRDKPEEKLCAMRKLVLFPYEVWTTDSCSEYRQIYLKQ